MLIATASNLLNVENGLLGETRDKASCDKRKKLEERSRLVWTKKEES